MLSVNYRSGIGYGLNFREAIDYGAHGASDNNDVMGAGLYLRGRPYVDPDRIGLWGGSYGGYLTALGLARSSDLFKAGVDFHGVHDWNVVIHNFAQGYDAAARQDVARLLRSGRRPWPRSRPGARPCSSSRATTTGTCRSARRWISRRPSRQQGVTFEQLVFPYEVHDFLLHRNWVWVYDAEADFFHRMLGGGR